jgi:hypothetical protein
MRRSRGGSIIIGISRDDGVTSVIPLLAAERG